jgi:hypothetical protein
MNNRACLECGQSILSERAKVFCSTLCRNHANGRKRIKGPTDFWAKVQKLQNGCWLWLGSCNKRYGYFKTRIQAHRYAYELMIGPVPDGLELDHLCRNRYCVNPSHLEAVSHRTNVLRGSVPKLTYNQAVQVALRRMHGEKGSVIARDYGVGGNAVCDIMKAKSWKGARIEAAFQLDLEQDPEYQCS